MNKQKKAIEVIPERKDIRPIKEHSILFKVIQESLRTPIFI